MNRYAIGSVFLLLIPLLLTFLAIWQWKPGSFILAFIILITGAALIYRLVSRNLVRNKFYRLGVGLAMATVVVLAWMNVAVGGILGDNPANMMYFGVLLTGITGAVLTDLKPLGMSQTLFATAFTMVLIPLIALVIGTPAFNNGVAAVFGLHAAFALLFVGAALLFRKSASL